MPRYSLKRRRVSSRKGSRKGAFGRRRYRVLRGRGDWKSFWGGVKNFGKQVWGGLRDPLANGLIGVGTRFIKRLDGVGDYRSNLGPGKSLRYMSMVPYMHKASHGGTRICFREMCGLNNPADPSGSLYGSQALSICNRVAFNALNAPGAPQNPYFINAGNANLFPWLSTIARNFQQYKFLGLAFEYRPTSGDAVAVNPAIGNVSICTQYDVYRPRIQTLAQMNSEQYVNTAKCSQSFLHGIECDKNTLQLARYNVRTNVNPAFGGAEGDERMSYMGMTTITTNGCPPVLLDPAAPYVDLSSERGSPIGYIWATYDVMLYQPTTQAIQLLSASDSNIYGAAFTSSSAIAPPIISSTPVAAPFGQSSSLVPLSFSQNSAGLTPLYSDLVQPGNDLSGWGLQPGVLNGFAFPVETAATFWQVNINYVGSAPPVSGSFTMGQFIGVNGLTLLKGVLAPSQVFQGSLGTAATAVANVSFVISVPVAQTDYIPNVSTVTSLPSLILAPTSADVIDFPVSPCSVTVSFVQLSAEFPNISTASPETAASF